MGYYSKIALKTTTEGWILMKRMNDKIEKPECRPLYALNVASTPTGYYKMYNNCIKWYEEYENVKNFNKVLDTMTDNDIPFVFIDIGEDYDDIHVRNNWTEDMPSQIDEFDVSTEIIDPDDPHYTVIIDDGVELKSELKTKTGDEKLFTSPDYHDCASHAKIKATMFELFSKHEHYNDIKNDLRSLESGGIITSDEYILALENWDKYLAEWDEDQPYKSEQPD